MKPTQSSIKSFFQPRQQPSYAPPPSASKFAPAPVIASAPPPPASNRNTTPPPATIPSTTPPTSHSHSPPPTPANLHPNASIRPVDDADLQPLRRINALLLPVAYPETFYAAALTGPLSRVITWTDGPTTQVVGGVVSRLEPSPFPPTSQTPEHALYIQSLALLSPYRSHGLATATISHLIAAASSHPGVNLRHVYAHVWTDNTEGMRWYAARGFERHGEELKGYYIKLRPDSAYIYRRAVGPLSLSCSATGSRNAPPSYASRLPSPSATAAVANLPPMTEYNNTTTTTTEDPLQRTPSGQSFQNRRAETEWNDLPADMAPPLLAPPRSNGGSGASSRSSSTVRKKRDRSYPAAAFS
ncbi:putative N-acetyltransferase san [Colletotrichum sidae]|uniref:Putative N-acetyltransferase san n=2 Tax=Colletotrichum orbiculare species complex TaxID=2707354 RepID=A0A4R8Q937_9PEZI|nr:putative N-acetyltransferase san [Colletotrichum spinosum]TEA17597.1 putative N-acetyltransferase san [Colletotrichum sidae]